MLKRKQVIIVLTLIIFILLQIIFGLPTTSQPECFTSPCPKMVHTPVINIDLLIRLPDSTAQPYLHLAAFFIIELAVSFLIAWALTSIFLRINTQETFPSNPSNRNPKPL